MAVNFGREAGLTTLVVLRVTWWTHRAPFRKPSVVGSNPTFGSIQIPWT